MEIDFLSRVVAMLVFGWLVLLSYRYIAARSRIAGHVFALSVVVRAGLGVGLFAISYLQLPIAESLQLGDGFWVPALDATGYYRLASGAADSGALFDGASAAPFYVGVLALWMSLVGATPAAAMFLHLCLYAALMVALIRCFAPVNDWRRDLPCIVGVAAYSFCPIVLFHSTQALKEELMAVLVATACLGTLGIGRLMDGSTATWQRRAVAAGALVVTVAIAAGAGVRWYYPMILWGSLAVVLAIFVVLGRTAPLSRYLAGSAAVLLSTWLGIWVGSGSAYAALSPDLRALAEFPGRFITMVQVARTGFLMSGGGTNVVVPLRSDDAGRIRADELRQASHDFSVRVTERRRGVPAALMSKPTKSRPSAAATAPIPRRQPAKTAPRRQQAPLPVDPLRAIPVSGGDQLTALATGLGLLFVPISLMQPTLGIDLPGGRGLLSIADVDTIFMDIVTVAVLTLLWRRRHAIGDHLPFVVFGLTLAAVTAGLLGYVVTNYGTLWRMRPLAAIPVWVLVVALSPRAREASVRHEAPSAGDVARNRWIEPAWGGAALASSYDTPTERLS